MPVSSAYLRFYSLLLLISVSHAIRVQSGATAAGTSKSEALQLVLQETVVNLQQVAAALIAAQQLLKAHRDGIQQSASTSSGQRSADPVAVSLPAAAAAAVAAVLSLHGSVHGSLQDPDRLSVMYQSYVSMLPAYDDTQRSSQQPTTPASSTPVAQGGSTASRAAQESQAADARQSSSRKLRSFFDLSVLSANLPDLEALLAEDYQALASSSQSQPVLAADASHAGTNLPQQSAGQVAVAPLGAAPQVVDGNSSAAGGILVSGTTTNSSMGVNCFSLPVELCIQIRRLNLDSVHYAYPYLFGYYALVLMGLFQTVLNASSTGTMVVDAQLLLSLLEQLSTLTALNGGLGTLVNADRMLHMIPL